MMGLHSALTGGIGSGKSTAAQMLVHHGAVLIDADVLAREVVQPGTSALEQIVATFGAGVLTPAGELDRPALADIVFGSPPDLDKLNAIVHPRVRSAAAQRRDRALSRDPGAIIVEDIPLLSTPAEASRFHIVIVVHTPLSLRIDRLKARGMREEHIRERIEAQVGDGQRLAIADAVLTNDGSRHHLHSQVHALWRDRLVPYRDALMGARVPEPHSRPVLPEQLTRALQRVRTALGQTGHSRTQVQRRGEEALVVLGAPQEPTTALRAAGFVPRSDSEGREGRGFISADPDAPVLLDLR